MQCTGDNSRNTAEPRAFATKACCRPHSTDRSTSLAATYAHGLARNHPFLDGNKRTAFVVCRLFLRLNEADIDASREEKTRLFLDLAAGTVSQDELATWIRARLST